MKRSKFILLVTMLITAFMLAACSGQAQLAPTAAPTEVPSISTPVPPTPTPKPPTPTPVPPTSTPEPTPPPTPIPPTPTPQTPDPTATPSSETPPWIHTFAEQLVQGLPGGTMADKVLQLDVLKFIVLLEMVGDESCQDRRIANTEVIEAPHDLRFEGDQLVYAVWAERWTVDRCSASVAYRIGFEYLGAEQGTNFTVSLES